MHMRDGSAAVDDRPAVDTAPRAERTTRRGLWPDGYRVNYRSSAGFLLVHILPLLAVFTGVSWRDVQLLVVLYFTRAFAITAGFHRYFSHRSYTLGRPAQFLLAFLGSTAGQRGPLWWAAHHRVHHRFADRDGDLHSPREGFWWSHVGWLLCDRFDIDAQPRVRDFDRYPEIVWLDRHEWVAPWVLGTACLVFAGPSGLLIGFFGSTALLWHTTFSVNSVAHVFGRRRFVTPDTSRNSLVVTLLTLGEGWHNNHHRYPTAARQGFYWWQFDPTYLVLRALAAVGVVSGLRHVPPHVLAEGRRPVTTLDDVPNPSTTATSRR